MGGLIQATGWAFGSLRDAVRGAVLRLAGRSGDASHAASGKPHPTHLATGAAGEDLAVRYLKKHLGMRILARNVRCPGGEIDIVALDGDDLVFVEVRTRTTEDFGTPEASIDERKKRFLRRAARWFIRTRRLGRFRPRWDIVAVVGSPKAKPVVRYWPNAFAP